MGYTRTTEDHDHQEYKQRVVALHEETLHALGQDKPLTSEQKAAVVAAFATVHGAGDAFDEMPRSDAERVFALINDKTDEQIFHYLKHLRG